MSLAARILLALASAVFGLMVILVAPPTGKAIHFYGFGAFCLAITLACIFRGRLRRFFGSVIASVVLCAGVAYLGHEIAGGAWISPSRSQPSVLNAVFFLLFFGLPAGIYLFKARFGLTATAPPQGKDS